MCKARPCPCPNCFVQQGTKTELTKMPFIYSNLALVPSPFKAKAVFSWFYIKTKRYLL